ncbi:MAG: helix-turn-helix transcriptional regulator [Ruminococcaceae bacterium]|nr:helix-turn-helix transcriptional regulator [Oscillospiraceae bacterium]
MEFGDILKRKREERRMTQADLAERIGTTQQNINSFETGYKIPPLRVVVAAADLFRCSTDEMIGRRIS